MVLRRNYYPFIRIMMRLNPFTPFKEVLCNCNEDSFSWLIQLCANIIQTPLNKPKQQQYLRAIKDVEKNYCWLYFWKKYLWRLLNFNRNPHERHLLEFFYSFFVKQGLCTLQWRSHEMRSCMDKLKPYQQHPIW